MRLRSYRFLISVALLVLLTLTACAPTSRKDPFAYAESAFSLSVEGTYLPANDPRGVPRPFAATVTVDAPQGGDLTERGLSVTFTAPPSLAGITVIATPSVAPDGSISRRVEFTYPSDHGNIQAIAEGGELDGLLRFAQGWLPMGDVTEVSPKNADGSYTVTRSDGDRVAVFTFAEDNSFPMAVRVTDQRGTVEMSVQ